MTTRPLPLLRKATVAAVNVNGTIDATENDSSRVSDVALLGSAADGQDIWLLRQGGLQVALGSPAAVQWQNFTPLWSAASGAPSIGDGTLTGRYCQVGGLVHATWYLEGGAGTSWGTGTYTFGLPVAAGGPIAEVGPAIMRNPSVDAGGMAIRQDASTVALRASIGGEFEVVSNTFPWTWDADSYLRFSLTFEAA